MMEVATKRYNHNHLSSYKNRGDKLGSTNRFVRAQRANKERKTCRQDELTKRRDLGLLNERNVSLEEVQAAKTQKCRLKSKPVRKSKPAQKENAQAEGQVTDSRMVMLMKWRENRELKKKAEMAKNQKPVFALRRIEYETKSLFTQLNKQTTKKAAPKSKENVPERRITRSSARAANKQPGKAVSKGTADSSAKQTKTTKKTVASKKNEEEPKRVTRQSARIANATSKPNGSCKKKEDKQEKSRDKHPFTETKEIPKQATPVNLKNQPSKSFAPANFEFTAPSGLSTFQNYGEAFKFQPLSPVSTENFFKTAPLLRSPQKKKGRQLMTQENLPPLNSNDESEVTHEKEDTVNCPIESCEMDITNEPVTKEDVLDTSYFRNLVTTETARLNGLCDRWEKLLEMNEELSEDVKGSIRTAVGQAQLLISQRFKQFSGLIDLSEDQTAEKKATMEDLQGFWDMVYFQVEDVNNKMDSLEKQKQNGWEVETKSVKKATKKRKKIVSKTSEASKTAKSEAKSKIQELRAAMKAKMAEKKKQLQCQNLEECSFITVLAPVKSSKKSGCSDDIILTPVRRSLRNTPINQSASRVTPKIISTPKAPCAHSPGLRLTPEVILPDKTSSDATESKKAHGIPLEIQHNEAQATDVGMVNPEPEPMEPKNVDNAIHSSESSTDGTNEELKEDTLDEEGRKLDIAEEPASKSTTKRSCLRSSKRRTCKSSHVFFQSPEPAAQSTAGGTPGPLAFTPAAETKKGSKGVIFTPVAVLFDSPVEEGNTCSVDAGHTPAMVQSDRRSLRCRTSNGTPISGKKRHITTPDSMAFLTSKDEGSVSKRRSLRSLATRKTTPSNKETFLPAEYILPSACSKSGDDLPHQTLTPIFSQQEPAPSDNRLLLAITPLKDKHGINHANLTPAAMFQALSLDDYPETRRDSVFFAPKGCQMQEGHKMNNNLICFSPLAE